MFGYTGCCLPGGIEGLMNVLNSVFSPEIAKEPAEIIITGKQVQSRSDGKTVADAHQDCI